MQRARRLDGAGCVFIASWCTFCITARSQTSRFSCVGRVSSQSLTGWRFLLIWGAGTPAKVSSAALQMRLGPCWQTSPFPLSQETWPFSSRSRAFCHMFCLASWAAQAVSRNKCLLPALSAASSLSRPQQDDKQRATNLLRPLLPLRSRSVSHSWHPPGVNHMVPVHMLHLRWPWSHLHEEIPLFSKERVLLWNWSNTNQPVDSDFQNCFTDKLPVLTTWFWPSLAYSGMRIPSLLLSVIFRLVSHLPGPLNL